MHYLLDLNHFDSRYKNPYFPGSRKVLDQQRQISEGSIKANKALTREITLLAVEGGGCIVGCDGFTALF